MASKSRFYKWGFGRYQLLSLTGSQEKQLLGWLELGRQNLLVVCLFGCVPVYFVCSLLSFSFLWGDHVFFFSRTFLFVVFGGVGGLTKVFFFHTPPGPTIHARHPTDPKIPGHSGAQRRCRP